MSITTLMKQSVDVYRQYFTGGTTSQEIGGYTLFARSVPCFIQPMTSEESFYYSERGLENGHTIYTSDCCTQFERNDILDYGGRQFHVVGIKNALLLNVYQELAADEYPENAKKRLDLGSYE